MKHTLISFAIIPHQTPPSFLDTNSESDRLKLIALRELSMSLITSRAAGEHWWQVQKANTHHSG